MRVGVGSRGEGGGPQCGGVAAVGGGGGAQDNDWGFHLVTAGNK